MWHWDGLSLTWDPEAVRSASALHTLQKKQLPFSVPQGSCAGPSLFLAYASTLQEVKSIAEYEPGKPAISLNGFADDHSIKKEFHPAIDNQEIDCITDLECCMGEVQIWMDNNCLKLNNAKTELILFGSQQTLSKCITNSININGHEVNRSVTIKYLGSLARSGIKNETTYIEQMQDRNVEHTKNKILKTNTDRGYFTSISVRISYLAHWLL